MARPNSMQFSDWHRTLKVIDFDAYELVGWTYFQRLTYTSASTLSLDFFTAPSTGALMNGNWRFNTLPAGYHFLIQAIAFAPLLDTRETATAVPAGGEIDGTISDIKELIYDGVAELKINQKPYGEYPLWKLSQGGGVAGQLATSGTHAATNHTQLQAGTNGNPDPRAVFTLAVPIPVPPLSLLQVTTSWDAAKTLVVGNSGVEMVLDGQLLRPRQ